MQPGPLCHERTSRKDSGEQQTKPSSLPKSSSVLSTGLATSTRSTAGRTGGAATSTAPTAPRPLAAKRRARGRSRRARRSASPRSSLTHRTTTGGIDARRVLRPTRMVLSAIARTRVILATGGNALVGPLGALVVGYCLAVVGDGGGLAVAADAGPVEGAGVAGVGAGIGRVGLLEAE